MASGFEQLQDLLVLSGKPVSTGTPAQWTETHRRLGTHFPVDYLQFVTTYGHCMVDNHIQILNPFAARGRFWEDLDRERATDLEDLEVSPPDDPRALFARPKGMIPWGSTGDGGSYLWVTNGADPDSWTVFVEWDLYSAAYPLGMEDFLVAGLRGQLDAFALGDGKPSTLPAHVDPVIL